MQQRILYMRIGKGSSGKKVYMVGKILLFLCYFLNVMIKIMDFFSKRLQSVMLVRIDQRIMIVVVVV